MFRKFYYFCSSKTFQHSFVTETKHLFLQSHYQRAFRSLHRHQSVSNMAATVIKHRVDDIVKSAEDKREYRGLELQNGLKVLLVSDEITDKSSAALDVHVGSMSDPDDIQGLAHFCEHMLFLGTEKYQEENEYNKFLSEHGGSSNAYTSSEHTNYYFDVAPEHLTGALDRFAQFFLSPLFTASATEREVNAVNSENDKNIPNDAWRLLQLEKATVNQSHPYSKFGTGNKDTLLTIPKERGQDVRDELLQFHKKYYSSNLMAMCVLGKESLDDLSELVTSLFAAVENKNVPIPSWPGHPVGPNEVKLQAEIVPVKDIRSLNVTWPIEDLHQHYKSSPGHYLGHLIGHEGPGSLLSELKSRGWVNTLVGGEKEGATGFMFFIVNVDLTQEGIEHVDDIITLIFQYINMLKDSGPQEWVQKECADLTAMGFRFKDKEKPRNYTTHCVGRLHDYPMTEALSAGYFIPEFKPELITNVLDKLTADNVRVAVVGQKYEGKTDKNEKWYGTDYSIAPIPEDKIKAWQNVGLHPNLRLPDKNEFIPTNFDLVTRDEEASVTPLLVRDSDFTELWYKQDDKFLLPKAYVSLEITSPYAYMDPISTNLTYMFVSMFRDALTEYSYAAELAGLAYDLNNTVYGLTLSVRGYNDKLDILLKKVVEKMATFKVNPQRFEILKENYVRGLKNFKAEQPYQHAVYYTMVLTAEQMWTKEELLESTDELTLEQLEAFIPHLLSKLFLEFLVYGNVTKEKALESADIVEKTLQREKNTKPLLASQKKRFREVQLPESCAYVYKRCNEVHKSSSVEVYYQCSTEETRENMLLELFCQIINEPCFDILRTQEQLGYIVFSGVRRASGVQGLRVIVQSDKVPEYVEGRVEAFLHKMGTEIENMPAESFEKHINALATKRLELPKKLGTQHGKYWGEIVSQQYNFDRDNVEVTALRLLTKEDILDFYKQLIALDAPRRRKLAIHVSSTLPTTTTTPDSAAGDAATEQAAANGNNTADPATPSCTAKQCEVTDVNEFKRGLGLFPLPKPFINISSAKSKL